MIKNANYITAGRSTQDVCPVFRRKWQLEKELKSAEIFISALGVYDALINGQKISEDVLMPGWTAYEKRLQYQVYDITRLLKEENEMTVTVGKGWFSSQMPGWMVTEDRIRRAARPSALIAEIVMEYTDGSRQIITTDENWEWTESRVRFSELYDGEIFDATIDPENWEKAVILDWSKDILIEQEGEPIRVTERVYPKEIIHTPKGETVIDFGQEITGYMEICLKDAKNGDVIEFLHGEVLDQDGNFYNANYRSAKAHVKVTCADGDLCWHPSLTFFGFRYIKLVQFPCEPSPDMFCGLEVHSEIKQTGSIRTGSPLVNQLISNIFWGQRDNFLDVPTDCPQRDERLGWTGDAQVFVKAASYNYDVEKFFIKWLHDMAADQRADGGIGQVIPDYLPDGDPSAAWGDAATICPWQIYQTYGNKAILADQFESMKKWVDYITGATTVPNLWMGGTHFGDWLGLDAASGDYKGSSREDFIATAFYAYSTQLVIKAGHVLGEDVREYELLYNRIRAAFAKEFPVYLTQTEHVLALQFKLTDDVQKTADALADMIVREGVQMKTGFVGTPYLLHVLSENGYDELAYSLLLREEYPSWLYPVKKDATTIWEHWDGIKEDGSFWSTHMNSFNHYAYGSVADWIYEKAAGIRPLEAYPGFAKVHIKPVTDRRLGSLHVEMMTRNGKIISSWVYQKDCIRYQVSVDMPAVICIGGREQEVCAGTYTFFESLQKT